MYAKVLASVALVSLMLVSPVMAVTNGQPDAGRHPYVGFAGFSYGTWDWFGICSGSLISPRVFVTAAHCAEGAISARVWFVENIDSIPEWWLGNGAHSGTPYAHPDFRLKPGGLPEFDYRDVAVVILDEDVPLAEVSRYAALPSPLLVDQLKNKTGLDLVGYGVGRGREDNGKPLGQPPGIRRFALSELVSGEFSFGDEFIRIAANAGGGSGGMCYVDSGAPVLLRDTSMILGVQVFGTRNCTGVTHAQRIDIPEVLSWIQGFLEVVKNHAAMKQ